MSGFQELFFGLHKIITPLVRLFEESRSETSHSIELRRFYQKVINEVFVLIGTCFLDKNRLRGLKQLWENKICGDLFINLHNFHKLHPTLPYRNTNLGLALLECLHEMSDKQNMPNDLQAKILTLFDIGIVQAFKKDYRETTSFRATLIHHYVHPTLHILVCHDLEICISGSRFYIKEVTIYVHGGKSSSMGIECSKTNKEDFMPNENWIVGTNDKDSAFIVCQCGLYRINEIDDNNNPIKLKFTHGILHHGSFEEVFSTAEGEMIRKCQQTITDFNDQTNSIEVP